MLGQSFGGLCVTTYLSIAPEGLREALITGGLPPLRRHIDEVYAATYERVLDRNRQYLKRYPQDAERLAALRELTESGAIELAVRRPADLASLSPARDDARVQRRRRADALPARAAVRLAGLRSTTSSAAGDFARNPLYAILHEACWADGGTTRWSAQRLLPEVFETEPLLTGEHVGQWAFEDYARAGPAARGGRPAGRARVAPPVRPRRAGRQRGPGGGDDLRPGHVRRARASRRRPRPGSPGLRTWLTNEYEHNGLRADGSRILGRLLDLARGRV